MADPEIANIVRLSRIEELVPLDCQILSSTTDLIVASELSSSLDLDGLCLIPTSTVRSFDRDFDRVHFYNAAVGNFQLTADAVRLRELLNLNLIGDLGVIAKLRLAIAVHLELDDPEVCYVGTVENLAGDQFLLRQVSSWGLVLDEPMKIALSEITKIEIATRYLAAITRAWTRFGSDSVGDCKVANP